MRRSIRLFPKQKGPERAIVSELEALYRAQAIISFNEKGEILEANDNFLGAMGYERDEIVGKHHKMFVDPSYANSREYGEFWAKLGRGERHQGEFQRFAKGGREVWIEASYNPVFNAEGDIERIVKFAIDVTAAKQTAADMAGQVAAISKSQAVIEFELDGTIRTANENFLAATGYTLGEIAGRHHQIFVEPDYAASPAYAEFWRNLSGGAFEAGEYKRIRKDGAPIWIQATYNPIYDANGRPFKVVKFATDVTERVGATTALSDGLERLANGDLSAEIPASVTGGFAPLRDSFNTAIERLRELVRSIQDAGVNISEASATIATDAGELSQRSESQASSLEETAATMEEISATISASADSAKSADAEAQEARARAVRGGEVAKSAIEAVARIEESSSKISDIVGVIDGIAFQTNLLALNAAVEAARAGDAGKGFAVVASEVRTLAQRSADAAKDISQLIHASEGQVAEGARLVRESGVALEEIQSAAEGVVRDVTEISSASRQQAIGVDEITTTVNHLDEMTQSNASMAEATASNVRRLVDLSETLNDLVSFFRMAHDARPEQDRRVG